MSDMTTGRGDTPVEPNDPLTADGFDEDAGGGSEETIADSAAEIFQLDGDDDDRGEGVERRPDGTMGME